MPRELQGGKFFAFQNLPLPPIAMAAGK